MNGKLAKAARRFTRASDYHKAARVYNRGPDGSVRLFSRDDCSNAFIRYRRLKRSLRIASVRDFVNKEAKR
jgi:hypothetical protein